MAEVKREGSRTWIEGVPAAQIGEGWDMLLRGMQIVLRHRGGECELAELMAHSGDAFSLCFASHWQGTAYLCVPTDPLANVARARGYEHRWLTSGRDPEMRERPPESRRRLTREVLGQIHRSIDEGRPVLAGGSTEMGCAHWSVVVGYDSEEPALCHVGAGAPYRWCGVRGLSFQDGVEGYWNGRVRGTVQPDFVGGRLANPAFVLGSKVTESIMTRCCFDALKRAVRIFWAPEHTIWHWGGVTYYFGEEAYQRWAGALDELDYPAVLQQDRPGEAYDWYEMRNMTVLADTVVRGREAAAQFCERAGQHLVSAKPHLNAAARSYRREVMIARDAFSVFLDGSDDARKQWLGDREACDLGAGAVRSMLEKERSAVREIENALDAEKKEVPAAAPYPSHHYERARKMPFGPVTEQEPED